MKITFDAFAVIFHSSELVFTAPDIFHIERFNGCINIMFCVIYSGSLPTNRNICWQKVICNNSYIQSCLIKKYIYDLKEK